MSTEFKELSFEEKSKEISSLINQDIKPMLAADGGSLNILAIDDIGESRIQVSIEYEGACRGCVGAKTATLYAIQNYLNQGLGEGIEVKVVD